MPYVTPVTNRTAGSPGYFNVADWARIYGNALYVNGAIFTHTGNQLPFTVISTPTTSSIPQVSDFSNLLANIRVMYNLVSIISPIQGITTWSYSSGAGATPPNWNDVNQWELCIDAMNNLVSSIFHELLISGQATSGGDVIMDSI